jgi:methylated-DNA-[protein]-cysteine S-methyltransferase
MVQIFYTLRSTPFGVLAIVWTAAAETPQVIRVFLPNGQRPVQELIRGRFAESEKSSCEVIEGLGENIDRFFAGESVQFRLEVLRLSLCSPFQEKVLLVESRIPRGWVSTYKRIAHVLSKPKASRAVGTALANNPFPIIIPCHRAIRSDGTLGGFQGGLRMKRHFLELEGIGFSKEGKVLTDRMYY